MVLGMSGPPGACAHPHAAVVTAIVPAYASSPRTEESLAAALQDKPSSATSLSAQVSQGILLISDSQIGVIQHEETVNVKIKHYYCDSLFLFYHDIESMTTELSYHT